MKTLKHLYRFGMYLLLGLTVAAGSLVTGCGKAPQQEAQQPGKPEAGAVKLVEPPEKIEPAAKAKEATPAAKPAAPAPAASTAKPATPAPAAPPAASAPAAKPEEKKPAPEPIASGTGPDAKWLAWYTDWEKFQKAGGKDKKQGAALEEAAKKLAAEAAPKKISDALELVAFDWKLEKGAPAEGEKATFVATWLFHKTGEIRLEAGHELRLVLRGIPDDAFLHYLAASGRPDTKYIQKAYALDPPLTAWSPGAYEAVSRTVSVPCIPYQMTTYFAEQKKGEGDTYEYVGPFGERANVGWRVALDSDS